MDCFDRCFYISISSEEDSHIKDYKAPKEHLSLLKGSFQGKNDSFITASSVALELKAVPVESSKQLYLYIHVRVIPLQSTQGRLFVIHNH